MDRLLCLPQGGGLGVHVPAFEGAPGASIRIGLSGWLSPNA